MESSLDLVNELSHGMELARQLRIHLNATSSSHEVRELLAHEILNSYDKALAMLKWNEPIAMLKPQPNIGLKVGHLDSQYGSFNGSPKSEDFRYLGVRNESNKRKSMSRWTQHVQVWPGTDLEGQLDDGYSWRKYGQKEILGAKYPRGYYRCTHRDIQGCSATKQVQKSDEDATIFAITYIGIHTCKNASDATFFPSTSTEKNEPNVTFNSQYQVIQHNQSQIQSQETNELLSQHTNFHNEDNSENKFLENYFSPSFTCPATSESNYYTIFGDTCNANGIDSEFMDAISVPTSVDNYQTVGLDYPFGPMDQFEPIYFFDSPNFFSNFQNKC